MTARRFASLMLAASLLHLNLIRVDSACGTHEHSGSMPAQTHHEVPTHHEVATHHAQDAGGPSAADAKCDTPTQPECCEALASCSTVLGDGDQVRAGQAVPGHQLIAAAIVRAPHSRAAAPDPPPPRA